jgi:hypothetical protein
MFTIPLKRHSSIYNTNEKPGTAALLLESCKIADTLTAWDIYRRDGVQFPAAVHLP